MTAVAVAALTAAEVTDARLDVISYAREVLERACFEHAAWRGAASRFPVTAAMAALDGALRSWGRAGDVDEAVRMCARRTGQVVAAVGDVMGPEAAAYVSGEEGPQS